MASDAGARRLTTSSLAKRNVSVSEKAARPSAAAKKRPALANITNQRNGTGSLNSIKAFGRGSSSIVPCSTKTVSIKTGSSVSTSLPRATMAPISSVKQSTAAANKAPTYRRNDVVLSKITAAPASSDMDVSSDNSDSFSVSMDESMSTCDSLKSPEDEYINKNEKSIDCIERKALNKICISENVENTGFLLSGNVCKGEVQDKIVDIDMNLTDPQLCATIACDIYKHLRASEAKKRPAADFIERVQKDINASMRAILIDWLVEVTEEYRLLPDTLYLAINYIDRYLSGNVMDRKRLQLLGVACMMIASKYEEICAPQVDEFCYITDNTYSREEVLEMESAVLSYLNFEMTAVTPKDFLRRFVSAAQGVTETQLMQLECMANYITELSLIEYSMLCFAPSLIAASSVFLAKFILLPLKKPWNSTLQHYTLYQASDLHHCVAALHGLCCNNLNSNLPAIREKYSQHKYKFAAKKYCPPSIPPEYFQS